MLRASHVPNPHDTLSIGLPVLDGLPTPTHLSQDPVTRHIADYVQRSGVGYHGTFEPWLRRRYEALNERYLDHSLPDLPPIKVGQCTSPRSIFGQYRPQGDHGFENEIIVAKNLVLGKSAHVDWNGEWGEGIQRLLDDALLHQMVHFHCYYTCCVDATSHGPQFTHLASELNADLGIKITGSNPFQSVDGIKEVSSAAWWPMNVRGVNYYQGIWLPIPKPKPRRASLLDPSHPSEQTQALMTAVCLTELATSLLRQAVGPEVLPVETHLKKRMN